MKKHFPLVGLTLVMLIGVQQAQATTQADGAALVDYFGYTGCIELKNEHTRVVLCPQSGGRVLEYSWDGKNSLYLDPSQKGWQYEPGKPPVDPCGGRFDIGPEKTIPRHPKLWLGGWSGEITGPRAAMLSSVKDEATGTQLFRQFRLDASSSRLTCTQTIKNISNKPTAWCHWSRTLADGGGICLVPLTANSRFPKSYIMYGPGAVMNFLPDDPAVRVRDGFLEILGTPQQPKLGMDSYAGWFCYLLKNDLMFVKRFPTYPERVYNEMAAITLCTWYFRDTMCELEPIGPQETLAPGGSASFTEDWWLLPHAFPGKDTVNLAEMTRKIEKEAVPTVHQQACQLDRTIKVRMKYLLYLPKNYQQKPSWPLLLFLHGGGEVGDDLELIKKNGPPSLIEAGQQFPFIVVSPQWSKGYWWEPSKLAALLDEVVEKYKVDQDRIYLTGLSMGGYGVWTLAMYSPKRFAALVPICGGGDPNRTKQLADIPIWAFHGAKDKAVPIQEAEAMIEAVKKHGGNPKFTVYPEAGHDAWTETYANPELYKWLLEQKRSPKTETPPQKGKRQ